MKKLNLAFLFVAALFCTGCAKKNVTEGQTYPQKIISLSPASTEILFEIGAGSQIAAVSDFSDYPPEALELPKVGGFDGKTLSIEKILSFEPDFVYLTAGMHDFLIESLDNLNIPYYCSTGESISAVKNEILEIGNLTGHKDEAEKTAAKIDSVVNTSYSDSNKKTTVFYEVWNEPFMSVGNTSFINDIISSAGATNIFSDLDEPYPMVSPETIIARQPQIILIPKSSGITIETVKNRTGWDAIPAVINNQIYLVDDNIFTRPGPRIVEAISSLKDLIQ